MNARIEDSVAWGNGAGLAIGGTTHNVTVRGLTIGANAGNAFAVWSTGGTLAVTDSVVYAKSGNAFHREGITHSLTIVLIMSAIATALARLPTTRVPMGCAILSASKMAARLKPPAKAVHKPARKSFIASA